ncbi:hypothetical protein ACIA49_38930 [Kribbella sp. NPDC051587]|uniref:hypothetical protein n=1 Tax=Kribbella sp. NPDC051587 TaxID=3364119 RepID=UPI0037888EC7
MTDRTRPLLIGYYKETFLMTATEKDAVSRRFAEFAAREGYALGPIVRQELDGKPSRFKHLVSLAERLEAAAVVVSSEADLSTAQRLELTAAKVQILNTSTPP